MQNTNFEKVSLVAQLKIVKIKRSLRRLDWSLPRSGKIFGGKLNLVEGLSKEKARV